MLYNLVKILQDWRGMSVLGIETGDSRICRISPNLITKVRRGVKWEIEV